MEVRGADTEVDTGADTGADMDLDMENPESTPAPLSTSHTLSQSPWNNRLPLLPSTPCCLPDSMTTLTTRMMDFSVEAELVFSVS